MLRTPVWSSGTHLRSASLSAMVCFALPVDFLAGAGAACTAVAFLGFLTASADVEGFLLRPAAGAATDSSAFLLPLADEEGIAVPLSVRNSLKGAGGACLFFALRPMINGRKVEGVSRTK